MQYVYPTTNKGKRHLSFTFTVNFQAIGINRNNISNTTTLIYSFMYINEYLKLRIIAFIADTPSDFSALTRLPGAAALIIKPTISKTKPGTQYIHSFFLFQNARKKNVREVKINKNAVKVYSTFLLLLTIK